MDYFCFSVLCLLRLCARLFICALWSPAVKRLTSLLSFVVSKCEFVTFPLVSWVHCQKTARYQVGRHSEMLETLSKKHSVTSAQCH